VFVEILTKGMSDVVWRNNLILMLKPKAHQDNIIFQQEI
jgi:hypothetical protein